MLKGIIFDMDGTITLTEELHYHAYASIFKEFGIDFTFQEEITRYAGAGSLAIFTDVFKEHKIGVSEEKIEECIARKRALYKKLLQESPIPLVPGVKEFLEKIERKGLKKSIATGNSDMSAVQYILERAGLTVFFPMVVSISEVPKGKPFPDVFLEAARRMDCQPSECVVFEDAVNGVMAAKAAGIACIALETTSLKNDLLNAGATQVISNYTQIPDTFFP